MEYVVGFVVGAVFAGMFVFWLTRKRVKELESTSRQKEEQIGKLQEDRTQLKIDLAEQRTKLDEHQKNAQEKLDLLNQAEQKLSDAFKALSSEALKSSNEEFLRLAKSTLEKYQEGAKGDLEKRQQAIDELVKPLKESLNNVDSKLADIEKARTGAYEGLTAQIKLLGSSEAELRKETLNLATALRSPTTQGLWGQMVLRNVVERAGMTKHCDFTEQVSVITETGRQQPDMVISLPGNRRIVVDSKVSLEACRRGLQADDEKVRKDNLKEHAKNVRTQISNLAAKSYWEQFQPGPECVVLFLPGEVFFSVALQEDPNLIEFGIERRVWLASPTTLIALLRGVAHIWRQEQLAENAQIISKLGKELYERVRVLANHLNDLGKNMNGAVKAYDKAVGSLERNVLVTARKFRELGAGMGDEVESPQPIDKSTRPIQVVDIEEDQSAMDSREVPRGGTTEGNPT